MPEIGPPRCAKRAAQPARPRPTALLKQEYGEDCLVYGIGTAGSDEPHRIWLAYPDGDEPSPPVFVGETLDGPVFTFDDRLDGYDAECAEDDQEDGGDDRGAPVPYRCPACGGHQFFCTVGFQQLDDPLDGESASNAPPVEDLFGWFVLAAECVACDELVTVVDAECA